MQITTLSALDDQALTDALNAVYEQYVVPFRLTLEQTRLHIAAKPLAGSTRRCCWTKQGGW
ncbi:MAG: hypothetical protein M3R24_18230 [Chloroflexota bacterium]|nr:hypothetical protein [Chloroflexota bacterium]